MQREKKPGDYERHHRADLDAVGFAHVCTIYYNGLPLSYTGFLHPTQSTCKPARNGPESRMMRSELIEARVSVIIPARNEEANIARALRSVAAQDGVREIIVADDQSEDRTPQILEELRPEFPNLKIIAIPSLPGGWTGKTNALATAARAATGEWLLFTDADTEHKPGSLSALLERAEEGNVDLLSLSPAQSVTRWWEKAVLPLIYVNLARRFKFESVSDPKSNVAAANGQYILIRREAYERAGGFEAVRAEILDDVALARKVKAGGGRILFLPGAEWAETRMYRTFGEMHEGWSKNLFVLFGGSLGGTLSALFDMLLVDWLPGISLLLFGIWWLISLGGEVDFPQTAAYGAAICVVVLLFEQFSYWRAVSRLGYKRGTAKYLVLGTPIFAWLLWESARAHQQGRVRWKGRDYSREALDKGEG